MSSMKSCGEQNWWSQVHHASSSERPDPSRAENPSEKILTVAALLLQISAGGCVANGCTYTHNQTQTRWQARISVLIQDNVSTQHHAHTKKSPRPSMVILWSVLRAHPSYCFVLSWPPFYFFLLIHLPASAFICFSKTNKCYANLCYRKPYLVRSGRWQNLSGIQRWGRSANKSSHADPFRSRAEGGVRETRRVKISQNVLSWALQ